MNTDYEHKTGFKLARGLMLNVAIKFIMKNAKEDLKAAEAEFGEVILPSTFKKGVQSQTVAHPN